MKAAELLPCLTSRGESETCRRLLKSCQFSSLKLAFLTPTSQSPWRHLYQACNWQQSNVSFFIDNFKYCCISITQRNRGHLRLQLDANMADIEVLQVSNYLEAVACSSSKNWRMWRILLLTVPATFLTSPLTSKMAAPNTAAVITKLVIAMLVCDWGTAGQKPAWKVYYVHRTWSRRWD